MLRRGSRGSRAEKSTERAERGFRARLNRKRGGGLAVRCRAGRERDVKIPYMEGNRAHLPAPLLACQCLFPWPLSSASFSSSPCPPILSFPSHTHLLPPSRAACSSSSHSRSLAFPSLHLLAATGTLNPFGNLSPFYPQIRFSPRFSSSPSRTLSSLLRLVLSPHGRQSAFENRLPL